MVLGQASLIGPTLERESERVNFLFVLEEILPGTRLVKTLNSAHEATWLVLIWLQPPPTSLYSSLFQRAVPGVRDTISSWSRGLLSPRQPSRARGAVRAGFEGSEERLGPEVFPSAAARKDSHLWGPYWLFRLR